MSGTLQESLSTPITLRVSDRVVAYTQLNYRLEALRGAASALASSRSLNERIQQDCQSSTAREKLNRALEFTRSSGPAAVQAILKANEEALCKANEGSTSLPPEGYVPSPYAGFSPMMSGYAAPSPPPSERYPSSNPYQLHNKPPSNPRPGYYL